MYITRGQEGRDCKGHVLTAPRGQAGTGLGGWGSKDLACSARLSPRRWRRNQQKMQTESRSWRCPWSRGASAGLDGERAVPSPSERPSLSLSTRQKNQVTPVLLATENVGGGRLGLSPARGSPLRSFPGVRMRLSRSDAWPRSRSRSYRPGAPAGCTSGPFLPRWRAAPGAQGPAQLCGRLFHGPPRAWPRLGAALGLVLAEGQGMVR